LQACSLNLSISINIIILHVFSVFRSYGRGHVDHIYNNEMVVLEVSDGITTGGRTTLLPLPAWAAVQAWRRCHALNRVKYNGMLIEMVQNGSPLAMVVAAEAN
jgi:hypothetical protein